MNQATLLHTPYPQKTLVLFGTQQQLIETLEEKRFPLELTITDRVGFVFILPNRNKFNGYDYIFFALADPILGADLETLDHESFHLANNIIDDLGSEASAGDECRAYLFEQIRKQIRDLHTYFYCVDFHLFSNRFGELLKKPKIRARAIEKLVAFFEAAGSNSIEKIKPAFEACVQLMDKHNPDKPPC